MKTLRRALALCLALALALSCAPALLAEPDIPYGEDVRGYKPGLDGYYGLLPVALMNGAEERWLPVVVYAGTVFVRPWDFAELSGAYVTEKGDGISLSFGARQLLFSPGDPQALFLLGKPDIYGRYFQSLGINLNVAPFELDEELWVPLQPCAAVFESFAGFMGEGDNARYLFLQAQRNALDVLAELAVDYGDWLFSFDYDVWAVAGSTMASYVDALLKFDATAWQVLAKQMILSDLWADGIFDDSGDDWKQKRTDELADLLVLSGGDEAFQEAQLTDDALGLTVDLLTLAEKLYVQDALNYFYDYFENFNVRSEYVNDLMLETVRRQWHVSFESNLDFLDDLSKGVGLGLDVVSAGFGIAGNIAAFNARDRLAEKSLAAFLEKDSFLHLDAVCSAQLKKNIKQYQRNVALYAIGKYAKENGLSVVGDVLSLSNPGLAAYNLSSVFVPALKRNLDAVNSFQIATVALQLEYDARNACANCLADFDAIDFTDAELLEALELSYLYLKSCYVTMRLAKDASVNMDADTSGVDSRCSKAISEMAILVRTVDEDGKTQRRNLLKQVPSFYTQPAGLLDLVKKMYLTVSGEVREEGTEAVVEDAECRIEVKGVLCGTFKETPEGRYEHMSFPVWKPESGTMPYSASLLELQPELTFTSPTVEGEDTVTPKFEPGGETEAEIAYLDWVTPQLKLIARERARWESVIPSYQSYYSFCVSDMNNNHRLELTLAYMMGTGHFTYFEVFEVSEDRKSLESVPRGEGENEAPDVTIGTSVPVYRDGDDYILIQFDTLRNGWAEHYESWYSYVLHGGVLDVGYLCGKYFRHFDNGDPDKITCYDTDANEISEEALDGYVAAHYAGLPAGVMTFGWQSDDTLSGGVFQALKASWEGFGCDLFEEK